MPERPPHTLDTYVQAAFKAKIPRQRRKKAQRQSPNPLSLPLHAKSTIPSTCPPPTLAKTKRCKRPSKFKKSTFQRRAFSKEEKFRVRGLVTAEELEDDDEAKEVKEEIRAEFARFGELQELVVIGSDDNEKEGKDVVGDVVVAFKDAAMAALAFDATNGKGFGGKKVTCLRETQETTFEVAVNGMLTLDELRDPDEVADVTEELEDWFDQYAARKTLQVSAQTGEVLVTFSTLHDAQKVVQAMNGSQYGGRHVVARLNFSFAIETCESDDMQEETKRLATPLVQPIESLEVQDLIGKFLKRLAALQTRAHSCNKASRRSRRLVLGMHEVRRGLVCRKIMLLVLATDLDGLEPVEDQYGAMVATAREQQVPVFAPMNRRKLGRVLQKSVRVSCVGVYSVDGANDLFQQILQALPSIT